MDIDLSVLKLMERERDSPFDELVQITDTAKWHEPLLP